MSDLYVHMQPYKTRGAWGHAPPRKFLEIRRTEIASWAILGQKQSRSSYMARGVLHPIFGCPCMHFVKPADVEFPQEKVLGLGLAEQQVG